MKKLSEYRNRDALDKLADIIEPLGEMMSDPEFAKALSDGDRWHAISVAVKRHRDAAFAFLAGVEGVPVEEYNCGVMVFPIRMMEVLGDSKLYAGFTSQEEETMRSISSGPATENTEEEGN